MELRDIDAAALMTPRTRMVAADIDEGLPAAAKMLAESGHSRISVYQGSVDRVIGTLTARDIVQAIASGPLESADFRALLHTPMLVPETTKVRGLVAEMRRQRTELAVVVDEYGGTAGLISIGDIVSELLGEIPDEYDEDAPAKVRRLADGAFELDAGLHVSEANAELDLDLPEEADFETLGGFVLAQLGRFPQRGESFENNGFEFRVVDASDRRVLKVRVRKLAGSGVA
jgi:CBS domain containing-hemolysin-like protein